MDVQLALRRGWEIATFNRLAIRATAADPAALWPGVLITAIAGALGGLGHGALVLFVFAAILAPVMLAAWTAIIWGIGLLFGGTGSFVAHYRAFAHAQLIGWLSVIPLVGGFVSFLWGAAAAVVIVEEVHRVSVGRALAIVLLPLLALVLCCGVLLMLFGAAVWSAIQTAA